MNQKERVRTKRTVDYGRACWPRVPELPHPVSKRNLRVNDQELGTGKVRNNQDLYTT